MTKEIDKRIGELRELTEISVAEGTWNEEPEFFDVPMDVIFYIIAWGIIMLAMPLIWMLIG